MNAPFSIPTRTRTSLISLPSLGVQFRFEGEIGVGFDEIKRASPDNQNSIGDLLRAIPDMNVGL